MVGLPTSLDVPRPRICWHGSENLSKYAEDGLSHNWSEVEVLGFQSVHTILHPALKNPTTDGYSKAGAPKAQTSNIKLKINFTGISFMGIVSLRIGAIPIAHHGSAH